MSTPARDAAQMGKIAARIESSHDGEALAAARMLIKRLGGRGFRIAEIIEGGLVAADASHRPKSPRFSQNPSPPPRPHRVKIDALLGDALFTSVNRRAKLTPYRRRTLTPFL